MSILTPNPPERGAEYVTDTADQPVISIRDLVMTFIGGDGRSARVLDGVNLDIYPGETLVIMGRSGCGKTTLLNCLIGELRPQGGQILYHTQDMRDPADILKMDERELNELRKRFGILFQSGALFNSMTVAENVALPLKEHSYVDPSIIDIVVTLKLQQVNMLPHRDKMPAQLSGGQKKRAGLARATALDPEILFYDEPSAGLDPPTSAVINELIMDLSRKLRVTSVVVTHDMDSAFRIADRMVMLDRGRALMIAPRSDFERIRAATPESLANDEHRFIRQFLGGDAQWPLIDHDDLTQFERWMMEG